MKKGLMLSLNHHNTLKNLMGGLFADKELNQCG